jgi:hypothetical protein
MRLLRDNPSVVRRLLTEKGLIEKHQMPEWRHRPEGLGIISRLESAIAHFKLGIITA